MLKYRKGSRVERELLQYFHLHGFLVIRSAGSGVSKLAPDALVFKGGKQYAFEIKAHETERLSIKEEQYELLKRWEKEAGITALVVWKKKRMPFLFIPLKFMKKARKHYTISFKEALNAFKKEDLVFS